MSRRFDGTAIGQFVFDEFHDAFKEIATSDVKVLEKRLREAFSYFFEDTLDQLGGDETGSIVEEMGYTWKPIKDSWAQRKKLPEGSSEFGIGLKGLLAANLGRLNPEKAYGRPQVALEDADGTFVYGRPTKASPMKIGFLAFPKVGRAPSRLIAVFAPRQRKILRYNEPIAKKGGTHNRPFLYPMFRYYVERELPSVFEEPI